MEPASRLRRRLGDRKEALGHLLAGQRGVWRKALAKRHPLAFGRVYFPSWMRIPSASFHWEIAGKFMTEPRYAVAAPVGSGKTVVLTKIGALWSAFCEDIEEVLIVTSAGKLSGMWMEQMGHILESSVPLREDYGAFKGVHWGADHLEIVFPSRRCFIRGIGWGEATRGRRPDRIIVDDPQDEASLKSEGQRAEFRDWVQTALINRLDTEEKKMTYIGTAISPDALICELVNHPWPGWTVNAFSMLNEEDGTSLWPDKFSAGFLARRREEIGEDAFQQEFQNNPVRARMGKPFLIERIPRTVSRPKPDDRVTACFDPAFRIGGDPWGLTVIRWDEEGNWGMLEERKEATGMEAMGLALLDVRKRYRRLDAIGMETAGQQIALEYFVADLCRQRHVSLPMVWLKHHARQGSKDSRLLALSRLVNAGRVAIPDGMDKTIDEMRAWRIGFAGNQDDHLMDSLASHMEVMGPRVRKEPVVETEQDRIHRRYADITSWKRRMPRKGISPVPEWWVRG